MPPLLAVIGHPIDKEQHVVVLEYEFRSFEWHAVLPDVGCVFGLVPLEPHNLMMAPWDLGSQTRRQPPGYDTLTAFALQDLTEGLTGKRAERRRDSAPVDKPAGAGLPPGNQTSQFFANVYPNEFDRFVLREIRK
jgi:hypothetical protein